MAGESQSSPAPSGASINLEKPVASAEPFVDSQAPSKQELQPGVFTPENQLKKPEVIANEKLPDLKMMYSIPVGKEWDNGYLVRSLRGFLSQKPGQGGSVEVNYLVNTGNLPAEHSKKDPKGNSHLDMEAINADPALAQRYKEAEQSLGFLRTVVEIQKLARTGQDIAGAVDSPDKTKELVEAYITREPDPIRKDLLRLAASSAETVAVSAIDITHSNIGELGYSASMISNIRTLGADYAQKRMTDAQGNPNGIFMMYDADTLPETNRYSESVIKIFEGNPELKYLFTGISYLPAGVSKLLVADSPAFSTDRTMEYNLTPRKGSPQIAFKIEALKEIQEIAGYETESYHHDEDINTGFRLMRAFGDIENSLVTKDSLLVLPTSLTSDRDGFVDGAGRLDNLNKTGISRSINNIILDRFRTYRTLNLALIDKIQDPQKKAQVKAELEQLRSVYERKQQVQIRFNRGVAKAFLEALASGDVRIQPGLVWINQESVLNKPMGKALAHYIDSNKGLISEITPEDLEVMKYYVGIREDYPDGIRSISNFQDTMREYLGDYVSYDDMVDTSGVTPVLKPIRRVNNSLLGPPIPPSRAGRPGRPGGRPGGGRGAPVDDKRSFLQGFIVESLALGVVTQKYFNNTLMDLNGVVDRSQQTSPPSMSARTRPF